MEKEKKDIYVLMVEDTELAKSLIKDYFNKEKITYAKVINLEQRELATKLLDVVD